MVAGDVVNTAARLQAAAPTNGILVGEHTFRATREAIEYREHQPIAAKGKTKPVLVWEVVAARAQVAVDRLQRSVLVGRAAEVALLNRALLSAHRPTPVACSITCRGAPARRTGHSLHHSDARNIAQVIVSNLLQIGLQRRGARLFRHAQSQRGHKR
jgi:hypothetical protein